MVTHDAQTLKGILSMLLLRVLSEGDDYGYSIVVRLQEYGFDGLMEGTVYPALTRLEAKGYLTSRLVRSSSGPARKYYRPTETGNAELARATDAWSHLIFVVNQIMNQDSPAAVAAGDERKVTL